jgi:hypothetical protein
MAGTEYRVYKIKTSVAMPDPDMPQPRWHHILFVETNDPVSGSGRTFHVTGDITNPRGMLYDTRLDPSPSTWENIYSRTFLGFIISTGFAESWDQRLRLLPTPPQQKAFNVRTMKTEPFKSKDTLTFYEDGEQRLPLIKCTEWVEREALPAIWSLLRRTGDGIGDLDLEEFFDAENARWRPQ